MSKKPPRRPQAAPQLPPRVIKATRAPKSGSTPRQPTRALGDDSDSTVSSVQAPYRIRSISESLQTLMWYFFARIAFAVVATCLGAGFHDKATNTVPVPLVWGVLAIGLVLCVLTFVAARDVARSMGSKSLDNLCLVLIVFTCGGLLPTGVIASRASTTLERAGYRVDLLGRIERVKPLRLSQNDRRLVVAARWILLFLAAWPFVVSLIIGSKIEAMNQMQLSSPGAHAARQTATAISIFEIFFLTAIGGLAASATTVLVGVKLRWSGVVTGVLAAVVLIPPFNILVLFIMQSRVAHRLREARDC